MARNYRLNIVQGETLRREFEWLVGGEAQDLSGYLVQSEVREYESTDAPLIIDLTPHMSIAGTRIRLRVPGGVTALLNPRKMDNAAWDLFLVDSSDPEERHLLVEGEARLDGSVTKVVVIP